MSILRLLQFHRRWRTQLPRYMDGEGSAAERAAFEAHAAACEQCTDELVAMRSLKAALRAAPEVRAPRSFRLDPAMLSTTSVREVPAPRPAPRTRFVMRAAQLTAAVAVLAFGTVVGIDVTRDSSSSDNTLTASGLAQPDTIQPFAAAGSVPKQAGAADNSSAPEANSAPAPSNQGSSGGGGGGAPNPQPAPANAQDSSRERSALGSPASGPGIAPAAEDNDSDTLLRAFEIALGALAICAVGVIGTIYWRNRSRPTA